MTPNDPTPNDPTLAAGVHEALAGFRPDAASPHPIPVQKALFLARALQKRAAELQTPQERKQQAELDRMMESPRDKATLTQMTDQAFRSSNPHRAVDQLVHILDVQGIPRFFGTMERTLLKGFQSFGGYLPGVAVPLVKDKMREETANVILPAEHEHLARYLVARQAAGVRMNVNYLGEALLGEVEAQARLQSYLQALQYPEIEVISVKISTIYSQISALAWNETVAVLCDRLELLYRAAQKERFRRHDGSEVPKFVYLDMEEYRDLRITAEAFMRTLDRDGLEQCSAGIALQAYVPDSYRFQRKLNAWARGRVASGGASVTIRLVKGANMETERVEASLQGWPQAPYPTKLETDANYKRMLAEGMKPENLAAVRVGVASHNLFDLAYALVLAEDAGALDRVQFEMLEGMANHQRRALFELSKNLLLYAPATRRENFIHAIGYLIRRLDENTGPENFLRHAFKIGVDTPEWQTLENGFLRSFSVLETVAQASRRTQDRRTPPAPRAGEAEHWSEFRSEPDTDFALPHNVLWAEELVAVWSERSGENAADVPLVIAGEEVRARREVVESRDPSRPSSVVARSREGTEEDAIRAVACARKDTDGWRSRSFDERWEVLRGVADEIRTARGTLMGAALAEGGKTLPQSDPEVSEAVDFVRFYPAAAAAYSRLEGVTARGKGVVVVVSPWNFPIAIPCGGVAAALAAGNTVILKPASDTVLVAWELCQCFWRAGVPQTVLQFLPCPGPTVAAKLVVHPDVDAVILTGGTATALSMLASKPEMDLLAETGGKNATIVTALADRDQAIKHVVQSAFGHSGQKCSATSLLILEDEVYDDPKFKATLSDAIESLPVGSAWEVRSQMGPLIRPPSGALEKGLKELEPGEAWAVLPRRLEENPQLYSPGVKWGVQPGSFTHLTEFFGPLLAVMRAKDLREAIALSNATGYGLTSGIESLDDREQADWLAGIRAGNLYVNRATTGAIVLRQPFGGFGKSAFGPGIKAGGPNYVAQLMDFEETGSPGGSETIADERLRVLRDALLEAPSVLPASDASRVAAAIASYDKSVREEFGVEHDHFRLVGQDNLRRYRPVRELRVRVHPDDTVFEILARVCAARSVGCRITVSVPPDYESAALEWLMEHTDIWAASIELVEESDQELAEAITSGQTERVRFAARSRVPRVVFEAVGETGVYLAAAPVLATGRIELLWYVREQSISVDYHRYGNLGARGDEERAAVQ